MVPIADESAARRRLAPHGVGQAGTDEEAPPLRRLDLQRTDLPAVLALARAVADHRWPRHRERASAWSAHRCGPVRTAASATCSISPSPPCATVSARHCRNAARSATRNCGTRLQLRPTDARGDAFDGLRTLGKAALRARRLEHHVPDPAPFAHRRAAHAGRPPTAHRTAGARATVRRRAASAAERATNQPGAGDRTPASMEQDAGHPRAPARRRTFRSRGTAPDRCDRHRRRQEPSMQPYGRRHRRRRRPGLDVPTRLDAGGRFQQRATGAAASTVGAPWR